jgi:hypothetical protein
MRIIRTDVLLVPPYRVQFVADLVDFNFEQVERLGSLNSCRGVLCLYSKHGIRKVSNYIGAV